MKFFSTCVLAATALMRADGTPALRSINKKHGRALQASDDEYAFLVSNIDQEDPWCIAASRGIEEFSKLGFQRCDFVESPPNQLWRFDSQGKIHSKVNPDSCVVLNRGIFLFKDTFIRIASCDIDTQLNKFIHDLSTDEIRVAANESYCLTNRGTTPEPTDTMHATIPCENRGRFQFTYRLINNARNLPLCIRDERGFRIPPNDPRFDDPNNKVVLSEITYEDVGITIRDVDKGITFLYTAAAYQTINLANALKSGLEAVKKVKKAGKFIGAAVGVVLSLFGVPASEDEAIVKQIFRRLNANIQVLQANSRIGFLQVREIVSNVALDELASNLDSLGRAFDDFFKAEDEFRYSIQGPHLFKVCSNPYERPDDIFFELYGYACDNCTYGSNRADIFGTFREEARSSSTLFMQNFGLFIISSMVQAMTFFAMCPPAEASCIDRAKDEVFQSRLDTMELAMIETTDLFERTRTEFDENWAASLGSDDFDLLIAANENNNTAIAESILEELTLRQPKYYFQVFVGDHLQALSRTTCEADECLPGGKVASFRNLDNILGKDVHIRFRHEDLELRNTTFNAGGTSRPFESVYQEKWNGRIGAVNYRAIDDFDGLCPLQYDFIFCTAEEEREWERITGRYNEGFVAGWDYGKNIRNVGVAAKPPEAFPSVVLSLIHRIETIEPFQENRNYYEPTNWTVWY